MSRTWHPIRTQEDRTCILIHTGKVGAEDKLLADKTGEGNNRTESSPVIYGEYPSVRYILITPPLYKHRPNFLTLPTEPRNSHCSQPSTVLVLV